VSFETVAPGDMNMSQNNTFSPSGFAVAEQLDRIVGSVVNISSNKESSERMCSSWLCLALTTILRTYLKVFFFFFFFFLFVFVWFFYFVIIVVIIYVNYDLIQIQFKVIETDEDREDRKEREEKLKKTAFPSFISIPILETTVKNICIIFGNCSVVKSNEIYIEQAQPLKIIHRILVEWKNVDFYTVTKLIEKRQLEKTRNEFITRGISTFFNFARIPSLHSQIIEAQYEKKKKNSFFLFY
jgi:hypothetical protein